MSKKLKGVALDSSPYGTYEDAKARFKHQSLLQDYMELQKEGEAMRNKLEIMKHKKSTLLAEVRFLRQRYKYLVKIKAAKPPQGRELIQLQNVETQHKTTMKQKNSNRRDAKLPSFDVYQNQRIFSAKETHGKSPVNQKISSRKPAKLQNIAPRVNVNQKQRVFGSKESACRNRSPVLDLNQMDRAYSGKEACSENTTPLFDLNPKGRSYGMKEANFPKSTLVHDPNQNGRSYKGKETPPRKSALDIDLNQMGMAFTGREDVLQNRAPVFDLNQILGEEDELQNNYEPRRLEEPNVFLSGGGTTDEQLNDLKLSLCRDIGNGASRAGKRKISWQDQVALKV